MHVTQIAGWPASHRARPLSDGTPVGLPVNTKDAVMGVSQNDLCGGFIAFVSSTVNVSLYGREGGIEWSVFALRCAAPPDRVTDTYIVRPTYWALRVAVAILNK